jgi:hypothetical protein
MIDLSPQQLRKETPAEQARSIHPPTARTTKQKKMLAVLISICLSCQVLTSLSLSRSS